MIPGEELRDAVRSLMGEALYVYRAERGNAEDAPVAAVDGAG